VDLSEQQLERYSRHIILEEVGAAGQEELLTSRALIIGAGGLGAPAALYLAAAGVIGCLQATEALKYLLGKGDLVSNALLTWNALRMDFRKVKVRRDPHCAVCGAQPSITALQDEAAPVCDLRQANR
jgi:Dinucleotide-utilizing enzymes involved in molybdopterin and thiamine biosynthesis family 2